VCGVGVWVELVEGVILVYGFAWLGVSGVCVWWLGVFDMCVGNA
jgi:hypothetical protein